ncbi:MAG: hypothetical protein OXP68_04785 [Anaerolineaceae bacterium]|nr:hypothetical protein [Anaerolineaceae bacterium]MDE0327750.1 hypothetical protein [Anaerolineaceae bacterium]
MELRIFLLADFANESAGKLNVIGAFNTINARQFPAIHPAMYLVAKIAAELGEFEVERKINVLHFDEDGKELMKMEGTFAFPKPQPGHSSEGTFIFGIRDMKFDKPSRHEFRLLVDNHLLGVVPLEIVQLETSAQAN